MVDLSWIAGHAKLSYTHHTAPIALPTKSGSNASFATLVQEVTPPCRLNPFLFNGHLQTMWTAVKEAGPPIYYKRKIFESTHSVYPGQFTVDFAISAKEGNECKIDETLPERTTFFEEDVWKTVASEDDTPMLVCLHGLSGGSHEVYLREVVAPITAAGWAACVVNGRGCAMSKITTSRLFNARATWDVRQLVHYLRATFPNRPLYAVGFSLGANILTNYVGEEGDRCELKAAVSCSNPWNLEICNVGLQRTWVGLEIYSKTMGANLVKLYEKHKEMLLKDEKINDERVKSCKYIFEFDRAVQAPSWGYPTEGAYYRDAQSVDAVLAIKIPFLAINAEDDPISLIEAIPYEEIKRNPFTVLCTTNWGGHLSWFQLGGKRWFATAIVAFFTKMHNDVDLGGMVSERAKANEEVPTKKYPIFDPCNRRLTCPPE